MYGPIGTINSRRGCLNLILGVHVPAGTVDQAKINTLKPSMVNAWCTDPTQRQVLNQVNIQYTYSDAKGKYIGKVDIAKRECR
jgi:hypothetical protein